MNIKKFSYVEDKALKSFHEDPYPYSDSDLEAPAKVSPFFYLKYGIKDRE
jgi:hypothetical protein